MFGVQFAVSSGRCTRGAFMLLIKVNKELKEELKCDFIMIIDTEGLKSLELAQLDDNHEHDNELATLVIGLSDVTIINIAMENATEMKDILQIVVHAFLRMKEVGKKPICHFVHQNVPDMSAYDNNMRDRKKLLEQLNEMTLAAARMEKKENITKFTDVMDYDPDTSNCYIPGLWHGTPPMAPVNAGYSEACQDFVTQKVENKTDYYDTYIKELLNKIDETLQQHVNVKVSEECEVSLKLHICGRAAREFQKMHDDFIEVNDPRKCLELSKYIYQADFILLFHDRDQCQKKAEDFTKLCIQPAVKEYVTKFLGPDVVDYMKTGKGSEDYSTRTAFQFSILKQLLTDGKYEKYKGYIRNYESFVKDWLFDQMVQQLSKESRREKLEKKHLREIVKIITEAISNIRYTTHTVTDMKTFIQNICRALREKLVFPKDALNSIMTLNYSANTAQFADYLTISVGEMEQSLAAEYDKGGDIKERLRSLPFKPQDKMFTTLFGCGKICPFCGVPCEAGGKQHDKHFSSIHRSEGIRGWRSTFSQKLMIDICSSLVVSSQSFFVQETAAGRQYHPYKDYQTYYPDWNIDGDSSMEAADYWKYVMATFNETIAKEDGAFPADIPEDWKTLTPDDALKSLKMSFNMR
ncbi:unnamed protein product [Coregonus sp. 'balchen']|nr:unnamed protein product [Coregonus sp. 'balchen']